MTFILRHIKNHLDIYIAFLTSIIATTVHYALNDKTEILLGIYSIGISISLSVRQYKIENDKLFKELFLLYNDKYDKNFNNSLNSIVERTNQNLEYRLSKNEEQIVTDYLNMCAEQYLWKSKGRIDPRAWRSWEIGMKYYLDNPAIKTFIENEKKQRESYYGLFDYLML